MTDRKLTPDWQTILAITSSFIVAIAILFFNTDPVYARGDYPLPDPTICPSDRTPTRLEQDLRAALGADLLTYEGCPEVMGAWVMLPMPENPEDRMQGIHIALMPDNRVLVVNGSSNRNALTKVEYPEDIKETGLAYERKYRQIGDSIYTFKDGVATDSYGAIDNTSIFDPSLSDPYYRGSEVEPDFTTSPFKRIPSPPATIGGESNDMFCGGQLQLPNGDILFIGGTRFYYPGVRFGGGKQANLFHTESGLEDDQRWENLGLLSDGHWYPTLVPLSTGAIAAFSGLSAVDFDSISPIVEIYDPNAPEGKQWQSIDMSRERNSPWRTPMNDFTTAPDQLDLYPRMFPTKGDKDRFLISGDGGGKDPLPKHVSTHSYFVTLTRDETGTYSLSFERGPERKAISKVYGTATLDPTSRNGDVLLLGGIMGTNDISFGPGKYAIDGASIVASLERWRAPEPEDQDRKGTWEIDRNFLARIDEDILQDSNGFTDDGKVKNYPLSYEYVHQRSLLGRDGKRAMEMATVLPTQEILIINGGNYAEHLPEYHPTLLTPDANAPQSFRTRMLNPDTQPRLYHNTSLLLPDGRVLVMGGNNSRAARVEDNGTPEAGEVFLDTINDFSFAPKGSVINTAEIWQHALFYPPYLFKSTPRPEIQQAADTLHYGEPQTVQISNGSIGDDQGNLVLIKLGSVTHSFDNGQRLIELPIEQGESIMAPNANVQLTFRVPSDDHFAPIGYYMLFYVSADGQPSHAKIVHLQKA